MSTTTVQIGNSDDKLTQKEWANFIDNIDTLIEQYATCIHFSGGSLPTAIWQNYCWVFDVESIQDEDKIHSRLRCFAGHYKQDSIAVTVGETIFLNPIKYS